MFWQVFVCLSVDRLRQHSSVAIVQYKALKIYRCDAELKTKAGIKDVCCLTNRGTAGGYGSFTKYHHLLKLEYVCSSLISVFYMKV